MRATYRLGFLLPFIFCFASSNAQIAADFTMNKTGGCSPLSIAFTAIPQGASTNATYYWDLGNGNTSTLKNPSAIYLEEKIYNVALTITDGTQATTKTKIITVYKKPVVDFSTATPKVCLPQGVQFTSNATAGDGSVTNWQWDFGDGITQQGFGNGITHNYSYEIIPAVSLTVTNSFGCVASRTKADIVEVLSKIEPLFTVNKTMLCNLDESIQLTNTSTGPGTLLYLWNFGDGTTSTLKNPVHQYIQKGVYQVRLTVSNTVGCSVTSSPISVNAANFKTDFSTGLLCRQANFSGSSFIFPSSSIWAFGDGGISTSYSNTSHTYASAGTYDVRLINTYISCKDTITKSITVQNLVNFNSDIAMPASVCKGNSVSFTGTSSVAPGLMSWNFGDGSSFNTTFNNVTHAYNQPGTYTVTLVNTFGTCSETVTKTIVVNDLPATNGFIADFGGVCGSPVTVTFRDTTPGAVAWQWRMDNFFGSPFSTLQNAPYLFSFNGNHTVYLTVTNAAGCSKTIAKQVNIVSPLANIFITQSSSPKGYYDCDSLTIKLAVNSNQPIQSYSWNFGNNTTSTLANPQVSYNQIGVYNVVLNYITESGCPGIASFSPRVYGKPQANFGYSIPCGNSLELSFFDTSPFSDEWNWKFGDGGAAFWLNPNHMYADTGLYNVTFINKIGHCSDTITKPVYANILPSSVSITRAENTCDGTRGTVTFNQRSVRASGGTWDFGDGTIIPYDSSAHFIQHTYTATGTYLVKLTSSYRNCNYTATQTVKILLKQNPILTANLTQLCANSSLNVQINNLQTNPFSWSSTWDQYYVNKFEYSNGTPFTGSISNYDFLNTTYNGTLRNFAAGTTAIRVIINDGYSTCQDTSNYINLQVNGPIAGFRIVNNNSCYKSPFVFVDTSRSATATPLTTWLWEFGDGIIINNNSGAQVPHSYLNPGTYLVRLTVTDATGCSKTVTAIANARGPKAAFTTSGLFVPNVPLNTTVTFFNNSFSSNSNVTYTWQYGDGATSNNFTGSHTYTIPGVYTVMLIASDPSIPCADTARYVITVRDFNTAFTFTKSFLGASSSCLPVLVRINNLSVGFNRVLWDFGDGTTSTQNFPSHTYYTPGLYRIILKTYGFNGITGTYIDSIQITQPSVQLSADVLQGCISQQVTLQATAQNAVSYLWDFGDGNLAATTTVAAHPYLSAGIYNPRLIVKDSFGCPASTQLANTIIIDSLAIAIKGIPALVCDSALIQFAPDVYSFAAAKLGTILQYKWNFGTGNPADTSNLKNAAFRYTVPGTYIVTFTVTSPYGCSRQTTATVVVNQKAQGSISALTESCEQTAILFTGGATPATGVQWSWNFGNGATSTQQNPSPQFYAAAGNYTVTLLVTKNGCVDTSTHQLIVHAKPIVNAVPRQAIVCFGNSLDLSANGGGTYLWTPAGSLNNSLIANPTARPQTSTIYRVQVTSDKGCVNKDSINITVAPPIDVQVSGATDLCKGLSIQLAANGATSYQWINTTSGLNNVSIKNPIAAPAFTTTYSVVGADAYSCFKDTASITIAVHDLPTVNAGPDVQVQGGLPYQLTAVASNDVTGWLWSPGVDLSCADCALPIATPKMETPYVVKVNNIWGCVAYDTVLMKLHCAIANVHIPDAFTPDNNGRNDVFYIRGSGVKIIRYLRIYDRWGGMIFEKHNFGIDDRSSAWDGYAKGEPVGTGTYVYVTELECSSGERFVRKGSITVIR
jgi:gliding motility-associated-like protein